YHCQVSQTVPPSAPGKAPGKALHAVRAKQWTTWPVAGTIARWYARRPFLTTWGLLGAGMVVMLIRFGHHAGLTLRQQVTLGEVIALLNNDTKPEPGWLEALVAPLEEDPQTGFCASKLLVFDRRDYLQAAGDGYSTGGVPVNRGAWTRDDGRFDRPEDIFGAS